MARQRFGGRYCDGFPPGSWPALPLDFAEGSFCGGQRNSVSSEKKIKMGSDDIFEGEGRERGEVGGPKRERGDNESGRRTVTKQVHRGGGHDC